MTLFVRCAYLGGVLTIVSPCILPVLPFVFARADQPFLRSGLPLLVGMAVDVRRWSRRSRRSAAAGPCRPTSTAAIAALALLAVFGAHAAVSRSSPTG